MAHFHLRSLDPVRPINTDDYSQIISLGCNCATNLALVGLKYKLESLPFDSVISTPQIIYDCLTTNFSRFLNFDHQFQFVPSAIKTFFQAEINQRHTHINEYGMFFQHFTHLKLPQLIALFKKRITRFQTLLKTSKQLLFIYNPETLIYYGKARDRQDFNYYYLIKICHYLTAVYPDLKFQILAFHCNHSYPNTPVMTNYQIQVDSKVISDNQETHIKAVYDPYRDFLKSTLSRILCSTMDYNVRHTDYEIDQIVTGYVSKIITDVVANFH